MSSPTNDIDTDVDSYTNNELLEILELGGGSEPPTLEDIQDKVQLMMRQYPSVAFFFAKVGERLESEYAADAGDDDAGTSSETCSDSSSSRSSAPSLASSSESSVLIRGRRVQQQVQQLR